MGTATCYRNSRAPKRKPFKRRSLIDKEKTKEEIPACSTSQTEVSAASVSASAHKIKNNLVRNDIQMPKECYFIVNSQLLTDLLSVIGKCPQCLVSIDVNHCYQKIKDFHLSWMLFALNVEGALIFAHQEVKSQGSGKNSYESMFEQLWVVVKLVLAEKDYLLSVTSWTYLNRWTIWHMKI